MGFLHPPMIRGSTYFAFGIGIGENFNPVPKPPYSHTENIAGQSDYILETFNFTGYIEDPDSEYSVRVSGDFS